MRQLLYDIPDLNIAIVNMYDFPDKDAMLFIINGVNSYLNLFDGQTEFRKGIAKIKDGKKYVSPVINERIRLLKEYPEPVDLITLRQDEVLKLVCRGDSDIEIANTLNISIRTVHKHKENLYLIFNVSNPVKLFWAAVSCGRTRMDDSFYYPKKDLGNESIKMKVWSKK